MTSYNLSQVLQLKTAILSDLDIIGFAHTAPDGDFFESFVDTVHRLLPSGIGRQVVYDSLMYLAGEELTDDQMEDAVWRLAGNIKRLRQGEAVKPWSGRPVDELVPVQITDVEYAVSKYGKPGGKINARILAGTPASLEVKTFWTKAYCHTFAAPLGFSKFSRGEYPFRDVKELINLRMGVWIMKDLGEPKFEKIQVAPSHREWNLGYIRMRARKTFHCPKGFPDHLYCYQCPVGRDQCRAAVHSLTFVKRHCDQCGHKGFFDPASTNPLCIDCQNINLFRGKHNDGSQEK